MQRRVHHARKGTLIGGAAEAGAGYLVGNHMQNEQDVNYYSHY
jgi:hypothetical protein